MAMSKYKTLTQAKESFSRSDYKNALEKFAAVLQNFPNSQEAYNGVILAEMALSGEGGAEALFDYYEVLKEEDKEQADIIMSEILKNMDGSLEKLREVFAEPLRDRIEFEDGILYKDFKTLVDEGGDFKEIFENIKLNLLKRTTKMAFVLNMKPGPLLDENSSGSLKLDSGVTAYFVVK